MNKLPKEKRVRVLSALVEGNSIRSTVRMTGVAKNTVVKLLRDIGIVCAEFHEKAVRNVAAKRVECDEIWAFCYAKKKNVPVHLKGQFGYGDVWTWVGIDPDTKLVISWLVGRRDAYCASEFMKDIACRVNSRIQLTTDAFRPYLEAVEGAFGADVDYSQLVKLYGKDQAAEARYSPPTCVGCKRKKIMGKPDSKHISTSIVERQNLNMRMSMRRFTRLTNAFSKKVENLEHAIALYFVHYNFVRIHQTLKVTPAMEAGVSNRLWSVGDIVDLLENSSN